jgi:hypothetical protein
MRNLDENLMGWLLKITQASYWLDTLILLMAESFFELLICSIVGFYSVKHLSPLAMTTFDYVSSTANIVFLFLLASFVFYTLAMTFYTLHQQRKNEPRWKKPAEIPPTSFFP